MPEELTTFGIQPKGWRGSRDQEPANKILDEEWVESNNVDSRIGGRRKGLNQVSLNEAAVNVLGVHSYYRPDGTLHVVGYNSSGKLYDDGVQVLSGLSVSQFPIFSRGNGTLFLANGVNPPYWRDPADNVWKLLQSVPSGWIPKMLTFHPLNKRLYMAPTAAGVDYYAWSNADFVGSSLSFIAPGGGAEYIGGHREPITGLSHGLGDDLGIFTTDHIYQVRGLDPSSWRIRFVSGDVGCCAPRTVVIIGHGLFFMHPSGCYLVNAVGAVTFPPITQPRQKAWDQLVKDYPNYLQYSHACWSANEHTIYLFVPTSDSMYMGKLWKFYLPDGSVTFHDVAAVSSTAHSNRMVYVGRTDGRICSLQEADLDLGTVINGMIRTKIYGEVGRVFDWGIQQKAVMLFAPQANASVTVRPIVHCQYERGPVYGDAQVIDLDQAGDEVRATVYLPPDPGWGLQFEISGTDNWQWKGFHVEARRQDLE